MARNQKCMAVMFIVASDGSFVFVSTAIWRSKGPHCFMYLKDPLRPVSLHYFSNKKALVDQDIMETILSRLESKMFLEKLKVVLFWENVACYPDTCRQSWETRSLFFYLKKENRDYNSLTPMSSEILNINTESCLRST